MTRKDNRNQDQFKKDIKYGTMMEKFWADKLLETMDGISLKDHGTDNSGDYRKKASDKADYLMITDLGVEIPLEIKWCPTSYKISLKKYNMISYIEQKASIYFIMNFSDVSLKKPKDGDWEKQQKVINDNINDIKWSIVPHTTLYQITLDIDVTKIPWMGGKHGYILGKQEIDKYMNWNNYV